MLVSTTTSSRSAVKQVAHVDDILMTRWQRTGVLLLGMRAAQQLAAQGRSAFDRPVKSFDNQGAIFGAVDDSQQIAKIMCVGLRRVAFDLWGRVFWKVEAGTPAENSCDSPIRSEQRDFHPGA
jgi:hypothetical protein